MAIIFISPQKKQKRFLWAITVALIFVVFLVSLVAFPPQFKQGILEPTALPTAQVPEVKINFTAVDSAYVKSLQPFETISPQEAQKTVVGRKDPFISY